MKVFALTYWSFKEPLIQAATLPYLRMIRKEMGDGSKVYLLTLEKESLEMSLEEKTKITSQLAEEGIILLTRKYYRFGLMAIISWAFNLIGLSIFCKREKIDFLHAFASPIGSATHLISKLTGIPYIVDSYEPHAESMVENGSWKKNSFAFKLLFRFEKLQCKNALAVLATTEGMREYSASKYKHIPHRFFVKPACVDASLFQEKGNSQNLREELNLEGKVVCIYAGKIGGIYLEREIFDLLKVAENKWGEKFRALILSQHSKDELKQLCKESGFDYNKLILKSVDHIEVPAYLELADFAINPVKPVPSKRYCTSIKDGEYWAMGLPVIIPKSISDDSDIIAENDIGAVLDDLSPKSYAKALDKIESLLESSQRKELQSKIRELAIRIRSMKVASLSYHQLYSQEGLLNQEMKSFLIVIYNSYKDPLFQNLLYQYIKNQAQKHLNYSFDLLTWEQEKYALNKTELIQEKAKLSGEGISWFPLTYHSGKFMLLKKLYDLSLSLVKVLRLRVKKKPTLLVAFANAAASISVVLSRLTGSKMMVYSYEPHSQFLADFGIWKKSGLRYKILNSFERKAAKRSEYILTGTSYMKEELEKSISAKVFLSPSAVDEKVFNFKEKERSRIRKELSIENRKVLIYVGKFGGIYYQEEVAQFCSELHKQDSSYYFIIITPDSPYEVNAMFENNGLANSEYFINQAYSAEEVAAYNSAADVGLSAIPPYPSQRYRSPVKTGEYLQCGLPYITCRGVSEDDVWAEKNNVGIVISELSTGEAKRIDTELNELLSQDKSELRERCRETGIAYRGMHQAEQYFEKIFDEVKN